MPSATPGGSDPARFITERLPLKPVPGLPGIRLHTAGPRSDLRRLAGQRGNPPYWAFPWAGGLALARFVLERPQTVSGRRVLDLGAGSGLVAIAAARAGAAAIAAADTDPLALVAMGLNAAGNGVDLALIGSDLLDGPPPATDLILAGDLFYEPALALRVTGFLGRCLDAGIEVLVGDPGRPSLPRSRLRLLAAWPMPDFGEHRAAAGSMGSVFAFCTGEAPASSSG